MSNRMKIIATPPSTPVLEPRGHSRASGFTLLELMVALTIAGILLGVAIPTFREWSASNRLRTVTNDFAGAVNIARSEAITRNTPVTFCRVALETDTTCVTAVGQWSNWVIRNAAGVIRRGTIPAAGSITVESTLATDQLIFGSDGLSRNAAGVVVTGGTISVCSTALDTENNRELTLGSGSRVSIEKTTVTCP